MAGGPIAPNLGLASSHVRRIAITALTHETGISLPAYMVSQFDINLKQVGARLWSILMAPGGIPMLLSVDDLLTVSPQPRGVPHKQERSNMSPYDEPKTPALDRFGCEVSEISIAQLVGEVYEFAPPAERGGLLEHMLRPLGVLSLAAVANGIFASIRFRNGWPQVQVRAEDALNVETVDVITLVKHVQQVSVQAVDGLADMLASSPVMTGSAAAVLLISLLVQRAQTRCVDDCDDLEV